MTILLLPEKPIAVLPSLAVAIGLNEAIALQQLHYWLVNADNGKHYGRVKAHRTWVYNDYNEWQASSFPFWSISTIRRTFGLLEKQNLVVSEMEYGADLPGGKRKWYTIDYGVLTDLGCAQNEQGGCVQNEQRGVFKMNRGSVQNEQAYNIDSETTTETTAQNLKAIADTPAGGQQPSTAPAIEEPLPRPVEDASMPCAVIHVKDAPADWQTDSRYVYIGRANGLKASKWNNPFKVARDGTREEVIGRYRDEHLAHKPALLAAIPELVDKTLVCWCAPEPCHGDILADYAKRYKVGVLDLDALVAVAKEARPRTPQQDMFQAICDAWQYDMETLTKTRGAEVGRVASELLGANAKPEEIQLFYYWLEKKASDEKWNGFTINAFKKYWPDFAAEMRANREAAAERLRNFTPPPTMEDMMKKADIVQYLIKNGRGDEAAFVTLKDMRDGKYSYVFNNAA